MNKPSLGEHLSLATPVQLAAAPQDRAMLVFGGYDGKVTFGDCWVLKTADWSWQQLQTSGEGLCQSSACGSHTRFTWGTSMDAVWLTWSIIIYYNASACSQLAAGTAQALMQSVRCLLVKCHCHHHCAWFGS